MRITTRIVVGVIALFSVLSISLVAEAAQESNKDSAIFLRPPGLEPPGNPEVPDQPEPPGNPEEPEQPEPPGNPEEPEQPNEPDDEPDQGDNGKYDSEKSKEKLRVRIEPILYLDFDESRKIINLTPHNESKEDTSLVTEDFVEGRPTLVYRDYQNGFQVVDYYKLTAGLGGRARWYYKNGTGLKEHAWAYVGAVPYKGKELTWNRFVDDLGDVDQLPEVTSPPASADDLVNWEDGDSLIYASKGGVMFLAGVGFGGVGASVHHIDEGVWQVSILRQSENIAFVKVANVETTSRMAQINGSIVSIGRSKYESEGQSFSFEIDISSEEGRQAFADLIKGNVGGVQLLAEELGSPVRKVEENKHKESGRMSHFYFGLPIFFYTTLKSGTISGTSKKIQVADKTTAEVQYGVYLKDKRSRFFDRHRAVTEAFYGTHYNLEAVGESVQPDEEESSKTTGVFGQWVWSSDADHASYWNVRSAIKQLVLKTGLDAYLNVNIPTVRELNYADVNLSLDLSHEVTKHLIEANSNFSEWSLQEKVKKWVRNYWQQPVEDPLDLCSQYGWHMDHCRWALEDDSVKAVKKMMRSLRKMKSKVNSDPKAFTTSYAEFGKAWMQNRFSFLIGLELAGKGVVLNYSIQGTHLSDFSRSWESTLIPGQFVESSDEGGSPAQEKDDQSYYEGGVIVGPESPIATPTP